MTTSFIFPDTPERKLTQCETAEIIQYMSENHSDTFGNIASHFEEKFGTPISTCTVFGIMLLMEARNKNLMRL